MEAVDFVQIGERLEFGGNARMHGDELPVDDTAQRHIIE